MTINEIEHLKFESIDSTNAQARRLAQEGEGGPLWIVAQEQTAGRGRRGRDWVSEPGNLFATHLLTLPVEVAAATHVSFVTALALHDTCAGLLPSTANLSLKWPNDVLLEEKKLAGILLETVPCKTPGSIALAVGCGVNLQHAPDQSLYPATWLNAHNSNQISPDQFMDHLAQAFNNRIIQWKNGQGFDLISKAWQKRASHIGETISLIGADKSVTGKFHSLAEDGALVLELSDGTKKHFHAGDVSLRPLNQEAEF